MSPETQNPHPMGDVMVGMARPAVACAVLFMGITGLAYPLVTTAVAQFVFPDQARGSIITANGVPIGSRVVGQWFTRPDYFHPRPSATSTADPTDATKTVDLPYNTAASAGSNLGPTNKKLIDTVTSRLDAYRMENGLSANVPVPADAATASASGLDPDISVANARIQAKRVAAARGFPEQDVLALLALNTRERQFHLWGYEHVNVLELNIALDSKTGAAAKQTETR